MREVLIGSGGSRCGAEKQPSDQTRQHQSAPVTRASTIGANIAILPAFTSGQEKRNARPRHRWAGFTSSPPHPPFERGHRSIRPVRSPYYSPRPVHLFQSLLFRPLYIPCSRRIEDFLFSRRNKSTKGIIGGDRILNFIRLFHICENRGRNRNTTI